jgi:hypothetical protein
MRLPVRPSSNAGGSRGTGAELLGVNAIWRNAQGCKAGSQIAHKGRRSADIEITIAWQVKLLERSHIQAPRSAEINIGPILGIGRAVANVAVVVGKRFEQSTGLLGKRTFAAVTGHQISLVDASAANA